MRKHLLAIAALGVFSMPFAALAQGEFPTKPIRVIVPFAPGGGLDVTMRVILPELTRKLGQPVIIENKPGAAGSIGAELVQKAAPDGYTLLVYANTATIDPSFRPNLPYKFQRDFEPITIAASGPYMVTASPSFPANNIAELIAYAKANPGKVNFGSGGIGSVAHLGTELFQATAKIEMTHIPFRGSGPAITAVMAGETQISFETPLQTQQLIESGKLKALAVTSRERSPIFPNVPSVSETLPEFELITWIGIFAPKGTPKDVINKLYRAISETVKSEESGKLLRQGGMQGEGESPEVFAARIAREIPIWEKLIREAKIQPEL